MRGKGEEGRVKKDVLSFSPPLVCFVLFFSQRGRQCGRAALGKRVNQRENIQGKNVGSRYRTARREVKLWGE